MSRKIVASVGFVAAAAALGLYLSRGPWLAYREQKLNADSANREVQKAEREKRDLMIQAAEAESPMGRERMARQNNYRKKDEHIIDGARPQGE